MFFDLLGLCLIYYPEWIGIIVNICVIVASVGITVNKTINSFQYGVTSKTYLKQLGYTLLTQIMGCVASFAVVTFIALILDATGKEEIILEQREVAFLSTSKICKNLNFSR